jgi:hypothetical protein
MWLYKLYLDEYRGLPGIASQGACLRAFGMEVKLGISAARVELRLATWVTPSFKRGRGLVLNCCLNVRFNGSTKIFLAFVYSLLMPLAMGVKQPGTSVHRQPP